MAEINHWNDEQKLMWLKVRLTGRALMAFKKFPVTVRSSYKSAMIALLERFEPDSQRDLYLPEFQTRLKRRTESWPEFGNLRALIDKAYPSLDDVARQHLALQKYLSQLDNVQVAFNVRQRKPKTIEAATLECESYVVKPVTSGAVVAPVQVQAKDRGSAVTVINNVRIPSFSELEISAQVRGHTVNTNSYVLEGNMKNSDVMVARAVVVPGSTVPLCLFNPTGEPVNLYSGSKIALLSEVSEVMDSQLECEAENMTVVSNVRGDDECASLEEMLGELVKDTSLSDHQQDLLLTLL